MFTFSRIVVALSAIAGSLSSPVEHVNTIAKRAPSDFVLGGNKTSLARRSTPNYNQDYTTGGDVSYTPSGSAFTVDCKILRAKYPISAVS